MPRKRLPLVAEGGRKCVYSNSENSKNDDDNLIDLLSYYYSDLFVCSFADSSLD